MLIEHITVDAELESFLPPMTPDERASLKASYEAEGFTDPLIVWLGFGILIDGHNRYRIWQECGSDPLKAPEVIEKTFADRAAVMEWMFKRQDSRRNWTAGQRAAVALKMKPAIAERAQEKLEKTVGRPSKKLSTNSSTISEKVDTRKEVAKIAKVSEDTVRKTEAVLNEAPELVKAEMLAGTKSVNAAFKETKAASKISGGTKFDPVEIEAATPRKNGAPKIDPFDDKPAEKAVGTLRRHLDTRLAARPGTDRHFQKCKFALNEFVKLFTAWKELG